METSDKIQLGILIILFLTLLVIFFQLKIYNRLLKAQLLRDRMEMFMSLFHQSINDEIESLHALPEEYMDIDKYNAYYKNNNKAIHKYILLFKTYIYLAFTYSLKTLRLPDPLTYNWTELWTKNLINYKEFMDAHEYLKPYYKEYGKYVESIKTNNKS